MGGKQQWETVTDFLWAVVRNTDCLCGLAVFKAERFPGLGLSPSSWAIIAKTSFVDHGPQRATTFKQDSPPVDALGLDAGRIPYR